MANPKSAKKARSLVSKPILHSQSKKIGRLENSQSSTSPDDILKRISEGFIKHQNPKKAKDMILYMRNLFPFHGIQKPLRVTIQKPIIQSSKAMKISEIARIVERLWVLPEREYQYFALDLALFHSKRWEKKHLTLFEKMIRTKSWWDTVDHIAVHLVGKLALKDPSVAKISQSWSKDDDLWIRRTSLLYQLSWKDNTNATLLYQNILILAHEKDFFIRKAIGWVLREYSKTDRKSVKSFIQEYNSQLSPLSIKEGSKYI